LCDQMAMRGAASPLWRAVSASVTRGSTDPRKSSVSLNLSSDLRDLTEYRPLTPSEQALARPYRRSSQRKFRGASGAVASVSYATGGAIVRDVLVSRRWEGT
jgi:hypothetical protein